MWNFKMKFIGIVAFFVCSLSQLSFAQENTLEKINSHPLPQLVKLSLDSLPFHPDSIATIKYSTDYIFPSAWIGSIDVVFDYANLHTLALDNREKWEYGAGLMIKDRIYLSGRMGSSYYSSNQAYRNGDMVSEGTFYRLGLDYKMNMTPTAFLMLGVHYGNAIFDSHLNYQISNPLFDDANERIEATNLSAQWWEIVLSSEQEFLQNVWLGWNARAKRLLQYDDFDNIINVYQIPGYGRTIGDWSFELNLYVKYRLPLNLIKR